MENAIRIAALAQAVIDAKDWRETFEEPDRQGEAFAIVAFGDDNRMQPRVDADSGHCYEGSLRMPRDIAVEMMQWLERRAEEELSKGKQV